MNKRIRKKKFKQELDARRPQAMLSDADIDDAANTLRDLLRANR